MNKNLAHAVILLSLLCFVASCRSNYTQSPTPSLIEVQEIPVPFQGTWILELTDGNLLPVTYRNLVFNLTKSPLDSQLLVVEKNGTLREIGHILAAYFSGSNFYILFKGEIPMSISLEVHESNGHIEGVFTHGLSGTDAYSGEVTLKSYSR